MASLKISYTLKKLSQVRHELILLQKAGHLSQDELIESAKGLSMPESNIQALLKRTGRIEFNV